MANMIEDPTLREMFRAECLEHATNIETGLLRLGQSSDSALLLDDIFREAHSLKGAARMLGLRDIQNLAHDLENTLDEARQGNIVIEGREIPPLLQKLDGIRALVAVAVGDTAAHSAAPLSAGQPVSTPQPAITTPDPGTKPPSDTDASGAPVDGNGPATQAPDPVDSAHKAASVFRIETLRIESSRLDAVFRLSAELVVNKGHIAGWRAELDELIHDAGSIEGNLAKDGGDLDRLRAGLDRLRTQANAQIARLETTVGELESGIRGLRLVPVSALLDQFPRMVHDLALESDKQVTFRVDGEDIVADKRIIEELRAPLMHLLRNAIDHGIETPGERTAVGKPANGRLEVAASHEPNAIVLTITDDGRGIDPDAIRRQAAKKRLYTDDQLRLMSDDDVRALILRPGFSTSHTVTEISGRGVGMDVVRASVERLRGSITIDSTFHRGTVISLRLPVSLTATRAVLVSEWGQIYAVPAEDIAALRRIKREEMHLIEGRPCFYHDGLAVIPERLGRLLERAAPEAQAPGEIHCVLLRSGSGLLALAVDAIESIEEIVIKPNAEPLARVRNVAGFAILSTGRVCVVLNPYDLERSIGLLAHTPERIAQGDDTSSPQHTPRILLVEDSITTRTQERRILEAAGYAVETAVDGVDAWNKLSRDTFDAVVSDVNMPRMSGFELTARIRADRKHAELPVLLVTSRASEADRRMGLEAGADAYITKPEFDQTLLLDSLARLL